jgi:hypothetical protein
MATVKEMMQHIFSSDEEEEGGILDKYQPVEKKCQLIPSPTTLASHSAWVSHSGAIQKTCPGIVLDAVTHFLLAPCDRLVGFAVGRWLQISKIEHGS